MNKLLTFNFLLLIVISSYSQGKYTTGIAYDFEEITETDQKLITSAGSSYIDLLTEKNIKGFWETCHSKFKEATPYVSFSQIGEVIIEMIPEKDSVIFLDAKKIAYTEPPITSQFVTGGSLDKSHPKYLQYYSLAEIKEQVIALYEVKNNGNSKTITMKFGLENSKYKLTNFEINTSKIDNKDAQYYLNLSNKWEKKPSILPSILALNMAYRFSYLGRGTQTSQAIEITEQYQKKQKEPALMKEIKTWTINEKEYTIIKIDFLETKSDISPNVIYLSKVELGEETTKDEANILYDYLKQTYPEMTKEFRMIMFTAYEEYPALPTKDYKYYRSVLSIDK